MVRRKRHPVAALAVAYLRASTSDQKNSPEVQRAAVERWAKEQNITITSWHVDQGVSGAAPVAERPALLAALEQIKAQKAGVLVVAKRDRLTRDPIVGAIVERMAKDAGAYVISAAGEGNGRTPADQFMRRVLDASAEYERELIRARTTAALQSKKARGERTGAVPYGMQLASDRVHLESNAAEQAVIARIMQLDADGLSTRAIASQLAIEGVHGRTGHPLSHTQVHRILDRMTPADAA